MNKYIKKACGLALVLASTISIAGHMHGGCGPMGCSIHNHHSGAGCGPFGCGIYHKHHGHGKAAWVDAFGVNKFHYNKHKGNSTWQHCGAFGCTKVKSHTYYHNGHPITRSKICHNGACHTRKW